MFEAVNIEDVADKFTKYFCGHLAALCIETSLHVAPAFLALMAVVNVLYVIPLYRPNKLPCNSLKQPYMRNYNVIQYERRAWAYAFSLMPSDSCPVMSLPDRIGTLEVIQG